MKKRVHPKGLTVLLMIVIGLGVCFRFINLDRKLFWHDEVYTSMRAAGYTRQEIDTELFQNNFATAPDLQKYQQIKPNSTVADTVRSLAAEDPQHPPFYFIMARLWMQAFGSSMFASRLLPALLSLLSLPFMYLLAIELFSSRLTALLATALLALSPFDILFAQTVRQYGLLTVEIIASSWLLLRALRGERWQRWGAYALSVAIGLYTHPFFVLTALAHGVYVVWLGLGQRSKQALSPASSVQEPIDDSSEPFEKAVYPPAKPAIREKTRIDLLALLRWPAWRSFVVAIIVALILYQPWIRVLLSNTNRAADTTDWTRVHVGFLYLLQLWSLSFSSLFFDLDFGFTNPVTYLYRVPYIVLIVGAIYLVCRRTPRKVHLFILTSALVPFLALAIPDVLIGGKRSAVSRYLISCYPAIQLAVAYLLHIGLASGKRFWKGILALLLAGMVISCGTSAMAVTWWNKDLSYHNAEVAAIMTAEAAKSAPVLMSDIGDDYTNTGDLISLSYSLPKTVRLYTVSRPPGLDPLTSETDVFVFRVSKELQQAIEQKGWQLEMVSAPARLWRLRM